MSAYENFHTDAFLQKFGKDVFAAKVRASNPSGAIQIAGIMAAGVGAVLLAGFLTLQPLGASDQAIAKDIVLTKSDRTESALPSNCQGQAWGAWSADCAAAISGNGQVRKVNFVTIDQPTSAPNTTVLARVPSNG